MPHYCRTCWSASIQRAVFAFITASQLCMASVHNCIVHILQVHVATHNRYICDWYCAILEKSASHDADTYTADYSGARLCLSKFRQ